MAAVEEEEEGDSVAAVAADSEVEEEDSEQEVAEEAAEEVEEEDSVAGEEEVAEDLAEEEEGEAFEEEDESRVVIDRENEKKEKNNVNKTESCIFFSIIICVLKLLLLNVYLCSTQSLFGPKFIEFSFGFLFDFTNVLNGQSVPSVDPTKDLSMEVEE